MRKINVSPMAVYILRGGFMVANALLLSSAAFLYAALPFDGTAYSFMALSQNMRDACAAVLFFAVFGSAFVQEHTLRKQ